MLRLGVLFVIWSTKQLCVSALDEFCVAETCARDQIGSISVNCNECICSEQGTLQGCTRKACEQFLCEPGASYDTDDGYFCCCDVDGYTEYCTMNPALILDDETIIFEEDPLIVGHHPVPIFSSLTSPVYPQEKIIVDKLPAPPQYIPSTPRPYEAYPTVKGDGLLTHILVPHPIASQPKSVFKPAHKDYPDPDTRPTTPDSEYLALPPTTEATTTYRTTTTKKPTTPKATDAPVQYPDICVAEACSRDQFGSIFANCNECICSEDGTLLGCTRKACEQFSCEPGEFYETDDGLFCCCNEDGDTEYCAMNPVDAQNAGPVLSSQIIVIDPPQMNPDAIEPVQFNSPEMLNVVLQSSKVSKSVYPTTTTTTTQKPATATTTVKPTKKAITADDQYCLAFVCMNTEAAYMTKNRCDLCQCNNPEKCDRLEDELCIVDEKRKCTPGKITMETSKVCCCGQDGLTKYCTL